LSSKTGTYIGVDLGGSYIKSGRIGTLGMEQKELLPVNKFGNAEGIFNDICLTIRKLWSADVSGIGFAVPALIQPESGIIHGLSNIEPLNGFALQESLEQKFKVPVLLQNDANCFVLGEKYVGQARKFRNIVGLVLGTGIGAGLYLNDQLYNGINFGAGEFGMIPFKDRQFEDYCSGKFFHYYYKKSGEKVAESALKNKRWAIQAFNQFGKNLGELINHVCYVLDPEVIILGGSISKSFQFYKNAVVDTLESFYFRQSKRPEILPSSMNDPGIFGAACLFEYNKFLEQRLKILK